MSKDKDQKIRRIIEKELGINLDSNLPLRGRKNIEEARRRLGLPPLKKVEKGEKKQ